MEENVLVVGLVARDEESSFEEDGESSSQKAEGKVTYT
jgi:hypothetical protein